MAIGQIWRDGQWHMSEDGAWLASEAFAETARISVQAARRALRQALSGQPWRDHRLVVRQRIGRGGRAGVFYEVLASSLPAEFSQEPDAIEEASGEPAPHRPSRIVDAKRQNRLDVRWNAIRVALSYPRGTQGRAAAIGDAAVQTGHSERTLYRWINNYEARGVRGLARKRWTNAHLPRVVVSRAFDSAFRAAGYAEQDLLEIAATVQRSLKGLWASRAERAGVNEIRRLAEFLLLEACEHRDLQIAPSAVRLSRHAVERFAHYRVVNQRRNDRKAFDDAKPRIRRDWTGLAPMERIVADVKHLDVVVTRQDGTLAWPKIVGFLDGGTGRVFVYPILLDRGEGVRQEHVIEAFLAMVSDQAWGFPQGLYLDNGAEFGALTKIDSALQLLNETGARTVIFARPYNASAKPIEGLFARLDRYVFSMMPGYAGPNRMAKMTQTVGRPPKPYPGTWENFCAELQGLIGAHNNRPVGGLWRDRSPNDWFTEKVAQGWRTSRVDMASLDAAFSDHDSRRVDRGVVRLRGERFTHPTLAALPSRTVVDLALPWRRGATPLVRIPGEGWAYLQRELAYSARWIEGAHESSRRQRAQARHVGALAREAPRIDPVATKIRWSQRISDERKPTPGPKLDLGDQARSLGVAMHDAPAKATSAPSKAELRRARELALTERLEREQLHDD